MLDQEAVGGVGQGADKFEFVARQAEAAAIVGFLGLGIDHEDLGRGLFDDGARNAAGQGVLGALSAETDNAVALADGLFPVLDPLDENLVVQRLPALVDDDDRGRPVQPLLDTVEQIHHGRRAGGRIVEDLGEVEADGALVQIQAIGLVVEQPGVVARAVPWGQARGQVGAGGPPPAAKEFGEMAQAAIVGRLGEIGIDRLGDGGHILHVQDRAAGADQLGGPVGEKAAVVEIDGPRSQLARLGDEEAEHHRLARSRGADDREVAQIASVKVEIIRSRRSGLQNGDCRPPVIVVGNADREVVIAGEAGVVAAGDQGATGDILEIAGELRPESRFEVDVLAHGDDAQFGDRRGGDDAIGARRRPRPADPGWGP